MTLAPNTPITQENVGLLKAGDWLRHEMGVFQFVRARDEGQVVVNAPVLTPYDQPSAFTYIGPDLGDGWIGWGGGPNPVPGMRVEVRRRGGFDWPESGPADAERFVWFHAPTVSDWDIIAFRPALAKPAEGEVDSSHGSVYDRLLTFIHDRDDALRGDDRTDPNEIDETVLAIMRITTPTPPSVDWSVVGPKLVEALEATKDRIQSWPIDDHEHCMCGSRVEAHDIGSGHSPVTQGDHAVSEIVKAIDAALAATQPQSNGD